MHGRLVSTLLPFLLLLAPAMGNPLAEIEELEKRQSSCPKVHVFGARETTAPAGYGTSQNVVNSVLSAYSGSNAEAINYPACGGQSSCGGVSYANSVVQGITAVANAVNSYNQKCPNTVLVLIGYSQGGQIIDDAYCGGGDTHEGYSNTAIPISTAAQAKVAAAILMGDPRYIAGLSYNVGTCTAQGFAPRPAGFQCPHAANVKSYCDAADPYCCNGNSSATHQGYANVYGSQALAFIKSKVDAMLNSGSSTTGGETGGSTSGGSDPSTSTPGTGTSGGATVTKYGQCGGQGYTGSTTCEAGTTCTVSNDWYSQCL